MFDEKSGVVGSPDYARYDVIGIPGLRTVGAVVEIYVDYGSSYNFI